MELVITNLLNEFTFSAFNFLLKQSVFIGILFLIILCISFNIPPFLMDLIANIKYFTDRIYGRNR